MEQSTIKDFGEIVNDKESPTIEEAKLILKMPHSLFDKLFANAQKKGFPNVEAFATYTLVQAVTQNIGATHIEGPAVMSGQNTGKITGYKGGIVTRG